MEARMWKTATVKQFAQEGRDGGYAVKETDESVSVRDGETLVMDALDTGSFWLVRYNPSYFGVSA